MRISEERAEFPSSVRSYSRSSAVLRPLGIAAHESDALGGLLPMAAHRPRSQPQLAEGGGSGLMQGMLKAISTASRSVLPVCLRSAKMRASSVAISRAISP